MSTSNGEVSSLSSGCGQDGDAYLAADPVISMRSESS